MLTPRWFQDKAANAALDHIARGLPGNPLLGLPTGTGKSLVAAIIAYRAIMYWPRVRVLLLTHVKELIANNMADLLEYWPNAPATIYSAGLGQKNANGKIVYAGIQSAVNDLDTFGERTIIIVDECHLMSGKDDSRYAYAMEHFKRLNPHVKLIGLTATDYRMGMGMLTDGNLGFVKVFDMTDMAGFNQLLDEGWLTRLTGPSRLTELDVSNVGTAGGDFNQGQLQAAVDHKSITDAACHEACMEGARQYKWLTFSSGIDHAHHITETFQRYGVPTGVIHEKTKDRDQVFEDYRNNKYRNLVVYNVGTTGLNIKPIDLIVDLRPTKSVSLHVQKYGRATRPVYAPGYDLNDQAGRLNAIAYGPKPFAKILDFAKNTLRLGPVNDPVRPRAKGQRGPGVAPIKICPPCGYYNHSSARVCCHCGYQFPVQEKLTATAGTEKLLRDADEQPITEVFNVHHTAYGVHTKRSNGKPTLRVTYYCGALGLQKFDEYKSLEDPAPFARKRARDWWRTRYLGDGTNRGPVSLPGFVPETVAHACDLTRYLREPLRIGVIVNKQHPEVVAYWFDQV